MNAARRKRLAALKDRMSEIAEEIEAIRDEEQEAFDNMPESLQAGDRGQAMESAIDLLDQAKDSADEIAESLENAAAGD